MASNRLLLHLSLSLGAGIFLWSHYDLPGSIQQLRPPSASGLGLADLVEPPFDWKQSDVPPSSRSELAPSEKRSLLRIENKNKASEKVGSDEAQNTPSSPHVLNQMWHANPTIPKELQEGINKGLFNVLVLVVIWFACMCSIGGIMRCYLCCETMRTESNYNLRSLYDSFMDRGPDVRFDNESEGIALDSLTSRDTESHDS